MAGTWLIFEGPIFQFREEDHRQMKGRSQLPSMLRFVLTRWTLSESKSLFYILVLTSGRECLTKKEIPSQKQKNAQKTLFGKDSTSFLKTVHFDSPIIVPIWKWPNHETMTLKEESLFHPVIFPLRSQSLTDRVLALGSAELSETSRICSWKPNMAGWIIAYFSNMLYGWIRWLSIQ